jgi:type VI secretion system protein ImpE
MKAKELFDTGHLSAAIEQLNQEVRSHPTDAQPRTFLFELLCFAGDFQRAERQLDVLAHQGATAELGVQVYRNVIAAEQARSRLFSESLLPSFLFDPPPYAHLHLAAVHRLREGNASEAVALLEQAENVRPSPKGRLDGQPFADLRDGDDLLAPFLEVFVQRRYVWLPFEHIKRLEIAPPKRLRDLLWIPATLEGHAGPIGAAFLPVLYVGSHEHPHDDVKLGRMTDWKTIPEGVARGVGQRLLFIDGQDRGILELREVDFEPPTPPPAAP